MTTVKDISIDAYDYPLPEDRIAKYPLPERDASNLLVLKDNEIKKSQFKHIGDFLPQDALLVFNETKVIRARLQFHKATGSRIEIFCLEPEKDYQVAFSATSPVRWKCLIGNSKRWKEGLLSMELTVGGKPVVLNGAECGTCVPERPVCRNRVLVDARDLAFRLSAGGRRRDSLAALPPP